MPIISGKTRVGFPCSAKPQDVSIYELLGTANGIPLPWLGSERQSPSKANAVENRETLPQSLVCEVRLLLPLEEDKSLFLEDSEAANKSARCLEEIKFLTRQTFAQFNSTLPGKPHSIQQHPAIGMQSVGKRTTWIHFGYTKLCVCCCL